MALACNINRKGRLLRGLSGVAFAAAGVGMLWVAWPGSAGWRWTIFALCEAVGVFQLFEAMKGWCIVRAMGYKTPV